MTSTFTEIPHDVAYEMGFDGDLGAVMSFDAAGWLDAADVELFMATVVAEELGYREPLTFGLEVEYLWRQEHPFVPDDPDEELGERWTYSYSEDSTDGSVPVTRFQVASPWSYVGDARTGSPTPLTEHESHAPKTPISHRRRRRPEVDAFGGWADWFPLMCVHHPDETAVNTHPEARFSDAGDKAINGSVHYCRPCNDAFNIRFHRANRIGRITQFAADASHDVQWTDSNHTLDLDTVAAALAGDQPATTAVTDFIATWQRAHPSNPTIAVVPTTFTRLFINDLEILVSDVTAENAA